MLFVSVLHAPPTAPVASATAAVCTAATTFTVSTAACNTDDAHVNASVAFPIEHLIPVSIASGTLRAIASNATHSLFDTRTEKQCHLWATWFGEFEHPGTTRAYGIQHACRSRGHFTATYLNGLAQEAQRPLLAEALLGIK